MVFKVILFFLLTLQIAFSLDTPFLSTEFKVRENQGVQRLTIKEYGQIVFDHMLSEQGVQPSHDRITLTLENSDWVIRYRGLDTSHLKLTLKPNHICEIENAYHAGFDIKRSFGIDFKDGTLINKGLSAFYALYTNAKILKNYGILQTHHGDLKQTYFLNKGIFHSGRDEAILELEAYQDYLQQILFNHLTNPPPNNPVEEGVIDDYGLNSFG